MKHIIKGSFILASALMLGGCKKFVDVNQNVNNLTSAPAEQVFSGALGYTYDVQVSTNVMIVPGTWAGIYAHSTSFTGGGTEKTYDFTANNFNAFSSIYDVLNDYQYVKDNADKSNSSVLREPADVMQCYLFQMLVDMYGNVPYSEALKGVANTTPKYDDQKAIYEDLVKRLDSSMARMKRTTWPSENRLVRQDVLFGLDKDSWIRFANTIKLRILLRQSYIAGRDAYITTNINNTIANGYLQTNAAVRPGYANTAGKLNTFYSNFGYDEVGTVNSNYNYRKMNAVIVNWLKTSITTTPPTPPSSTTPAANSSADTFRLERLVAPKPNSAGAPNDFVGVPLGSTSGFGTGATSAIGPFAITLGEGNHPGFLMLAAESYFLQAEAAQRYSIMFGGMDAKALYQMGVHSHFWTVADPFSDGATPNEGEDYASRYLARTGTRADNINFDLSVNKIRAIQIQKWVSLVHINGLEAWSEYRRTNGTPEVNVPQLPKTIGSTSNPEPNRYLIPQTELNTNSANAPRNDRFARLFWDVN
ncbi:SusD/RagB family nutrient-binding outer membrane lipoprotein [Flaviaesturariibacter flavus]|uniref:SusD/RagB family nutrient-binding outer membrane lipoprotein n=1 Tax=Flaviaesturariibacter flavus TaxID=2502780 RepID=A0A4R1B5H9_9BACT|nr:SusD/RagB family nutrient-binding outer membrane lipoprotein [Flaviaesturariibacter flavus]TCJ13394.1 SusD/RagB family nutrient-binding outer membrane lipoprotein [Flaviaesturariibacter flavus]